MELDKMKSIWEKESNDYVKNNEIEQHKIQSLMKSKSQMTFSQIKRSMQYKSGIAGVIGTGALILAAMYLTGAIVEPLSLAPFLSAMETGVILLLMGSIVCVTAVANLFSYHRIKEFERSSEPLKLMLKESVDILRNIISLGTYSDAIFVPIISGFIAYKWLFGSSGLVWDIHLLYLVLVVAATALLSHFIANRLMHQKHGGHLERLRGYLNELESGNGELGQVDTPIEFS